MNVEQPEIVIAPRSNWTFGTALRFVFRLSPKIPSDIQACVERVANGTDASRGSAPR